MSSSTVRPPAQVFHHSCYAMHTRFSMVLVGIDDEKAAALAIAAERELASCERLMSRFDAESPVAELNRRAAEIAVRPPDELWEILLLCRDYWKRTEGAFDITLLPLSRLWRSCLERGEEPSEEAIANAKHQTGMKRLHMDEAAHTVRFESQGMSIDLGGFGKGFALERLAASLRAQGVRQAFLSFGESSITVLGSHPHGSSSLSSLSWPVGVANMFDPTQTVHTFYLRDASLSTSGTTPLNRAGGEPLFGQIIHPRTGRPVEGYRTLSVAGPSGIEAEALSTALLVTPEDERARILHKFPQFSAVEVVYQLSEGKFAPRTRWKYGS